MSRDNDPESLSDSELAEAVAHARDRWIACETEFQKARVSYLRLQRVQTTRMIERFHEDNDLEANQKTQ